MDAFASVEKCKCGIGIFPKPFDRRIEAYAHQNLRFRVVFDNRLQCAVEVRVVGRFSVLYVVVRRLYGERYDVHARLAREAHLRFDARNGLRRERPVLSFVFVEHCIEVFERREVLACLDSEIDFVRLARLEFDVFYIDVDLVEQPRLLCDCNAQRAVLCAVDLRVFHFERQLFHPAFANAPETDSRVDIFAVEFEGEDLFSAFRLDHFEFRQVVFHRFVFRFDLESAVGDLLFLRVYVERDLAPLCAERLDYGRGGCKVCGRNVQHTRPLGLAVDHNARDPSYVGDCRAFYFEFVLSAAGGCKKYRSRRHKYTDFFHSGNLYSAP